jgi:hypothetical protein
MGFEMNEKLFKWLTKHLNPEFKEAWYDLDMYCGVEVVVWSDDLAMYCMFDGI